MVSRLPKNLSIRHVCVGVYIVCACDQLDWIESSNIEIHLAFFQSHAPHEPLIGPLSVVDDAVKSDTQTHDHALLPKN